MRVRPLTRAEFQAIRDRNYKSRHRRRFLTKKEDGRSKSWKFGERRSLPHGPWGRCPNCNDATKQRAVYAVVTLPDGKRVWEKVFMLCRKCLWRRKANPLIPVRAKVYSRNQSLGYSPLPILSILNGGPLNLDRLIFRLRKSVIEGNEFQIKEVVKSWVDSGLITETEIDYTQKIIDTIQSSKMRLRECPVEHRKSLLPLYVQSRKGHLVVEKLGYYCVSCKKFTLIKPRRTKHDALDVLLSRQSPCVPREPDPLDALLAQTLRRDLSTPS